jgi:hypothetical protein
MASMSVGIESVKKWVDYWRKFKGKKVRIWFVRKDRGSIAQYSCVTTEKVGKELRRRKIDYGEIDLNLQQYEERQDEGLRILEAITCVDGSISDVVDSPFGMMLADVRLWRVIAPEPKNENNVTIREHNREIEQIFIPMSEIARIDFLTKHYQ